MSNKSNSIIIVFLKEIVEGKGIEPLTNPCSTRYHLAAASPSVLCRSRLDTCGCIFRHSSSVYSVIRDVRQPKGFRLNLLAYRCGFSDIPILWRCLADFRFQSLLLTSGGSKGTSNQKSVPTCSVDDVGSTAASKDASSWRYPKLLLAFTYYIYVCLCYTNKLL